MKTQFLTYWTSKVSWNLFLFMTTFYYIFIVQSRFSQIEIEITPQISTSIKFEILKIWPQNWFHSEIFPLDWRGKLFWSEKILNPCYFTDILGYKRCEWFLLLFEKTWPVKMSLIKPWKSETKEMWLGRILFKMPVFQKIFEMTIIVACGPSLW